MSKVRVKIETVFVGGGPVQSSVTLRPTDLGEDDAHFGLLPINIGHAEAYTLALGVRKAEQQRPSTHILMLNMIELLGGVVRSVCLTKVENDIFYAEIHLDDYNGNAQIIDARPSDAIALAQRADVPIYVEDEVLTVAAQPDFSAAEKEAQQAQLKEFHDFVQDLKPEDFE